MMLEVFFASNFVQIQFVNWSLKAHIKVGTFYANENDDCNILTLLVMHFFCQWC